MASEDRTVTDIKSNFALDIVQSLGLYLVKEHPFDINVIVGDSKFECHRLVLSAHSGYFRTEFNTRPEENKYIHQLDLENISSEAFRLIHQTMYIGCYILTDDNVIDLMKAANYLQIPFLEKECVRYLKTLLSLENCMDLYLSGTKSNSERVKNFVWPFILENFNSLYSTDKFGELSKDDILKLVQSQDLVTTSEDCVVDAILVWAENQTWEKEDKNVSPNEKIEERINAKKDNAEPANKMRKLESDLKMAVNDKSDTREETLLAMFKHVKLFLVSEKCLEKLNEHPLVQGNCKLKDLIIKALSYHAFIGKRDVYWPANATHRKISKFVHSVLLTSRNGQDFEIESHLIALKRWCSVFPKSFSKATTLKLATIDTSLFAFTTKRILQSESGNTTNKRVLEISQILNEKWSNIAKLSLPLEENYSIVTVERSFYILSPLEKNLWKLDSSTRKLETLKDLPSNQPISYAMRYAEVILVFYSEEVPGTKKIQTSIHCYDVQNKNWSPIISKLFCTASGMTSFKDETNTYILQCSGYLWKIVPSTSGSIDFQLLKRLWLIDWPLHGVVIFMNKLYIYGVRSTKHENDYRMKSFQGFLKIKYVYYKYYIQSSTFVPCILNRYLLLD
ncbi:kelch-like protein 5 [Biomphalaria glabrata]|uniref:Uncharacterized protein LOC129923124 n=1 Tax=Biomphalaria glabrata TaxID=6526 RepID=A0A9W2Z148_BIOGL|nr:uncharacterized protein LOC129923124 [Biomphalaria glabrata]